MPASGFLVQTALHLGALAGQFLLMGRGQFGDPAFMVGLQIGGGPAMDLGTVAILPVAALQFLAMRRRGLGGQAFMFGAGAGQGGLGVRQPGAQIGD